MGGKRKVKTFRKVEAVKAMARERIGTPPPARVEKNRRKTVEKHKPTLGRLLEDG